MADTIASPLLSCLCDRLNSVTDSSSFQIWKKNRSTLMDLKKWVPSAEQASEREMELWLKDVIDVACEGDDLLDEFELYVVLPLNELEIKVINFFFPTTPSCFPLVLSLLPRQTTMLVHKLRRIEARLDELVHKSSILRRSVHLKAETVGVDNPRHTVSSINRNDVVGRKEDEKTVVDLLLENSYGEKFYVVEIVGMGGIGKTTLAQLVYNNDAVCEAFEFRAWVCVSEDFDVMRIAKEIIEAATRGSYMDRIWSLEVLGEKLIEVLRNKKFLIVLDDVWTGTGDKYWSMLATWFAFGSPGSKVLLTTRSSEVAAFTSGHGEFWSYFLGHLSDEDCWSLFHRRASLERYEDEEGKDKIFEIGEAIVAMCKGLPLAVKVLADLMNLKQTVHDWLSMMEIDIWQLPAFERSVLPILRLSYNHLPPHLKPCFAFCSVFPKDCSINKEKLIQFWISNRLIGNPRKGDRTLEEIGSDYFEELVERSFFVDVSRDEYSDMLTMCRMHDFIHELALSVAGSWCSVVQTGILQQDISDELHHSSLICTTGEPLSSSILQLLIRAKNLRTLLLFSGKLEKVPSSIFRVLRCIRVLDLSQTGLRELPVSVGHLIHLRFLDLSHTYIKILPKSIAKLKFLQSLQLAGCSHLQELPKAISKLKSLRHLNIQSCCLLSQMPFGIGKLRLLQTLPTFLLSETDGCGSLSDLGGLNLRGRLEIKNLEHVGDLAEADGAELYKKLHLLSLGLSWGRDSTVDDLVLEKLRPSQNLKVLDIIGYIGSFPSWLCDRDLRLVKLSLINCYCDELPTLGQLPHLRHLHLKGLPRVQFIGSEFYGDYVVRAFQSLKQLELYDMANLVKWENSKAEVAFPCLDTLSIKGCPELAELPLLSNVRKLALSKCNLMLLESLAHLSSLSFLVINEMRDHKSLSLKLGSLNSIRTLTVYNCDSLLFKLDDGMWKFYSLEHLSILYCKELKSLPMGLGDLTLQKLHIIECHDLAYIPDVPFFSDLQELTIEGCPNLVSFPGEAIQRLVNSSDRKVVIQRCPKLETYLYAEEGDEV